MEEIERIERQLEQLQSILTPELQESISPAAEMPEIGGSSAAVLAALDWGLSVGGYPSLQWRSLVL